MTHDVGDAEMIESDLLGHRGTRQMGKTINVNRAGKQAAVNKEGIARDRSICSITRIRMHGIEWSYRLNSYRQRASRLARCLV